ncbi:glutamine-hydrolyzing carbamoyl-phosphate synthase small subunit [Candidatus Roizmanbacteria bacterium]|nr:glutamine-hydrolyzing carbamoyl-phosphate synthase small subunit [Candidatus Roizmanbacteria bacterium]
MINPILEFQNGIIFKGKSFGYEGFTSGEIAFATGMTGYPESLTDPSYKGQILVLTYPIIGNYGVQDLSSWESSHIQISGLIVSIYNETPSHHKSIYLLAEWLEREKIPALEISDTRLITQTIRDKGSSLVRIIINDNNIPRFHDPNEDNLVALVSSKKVLTEGQGKKHIVLIDCGIKENIRREFLKRDVKLTTVPWDFDIFSEMKSFDGLFISNGPGDPKIVSQTIETVKKALQKKVPTFGICLGNQILALAAGGDTYKLKFGHRGQNQPCYEVGTRRCYITTQNHGFAVGRIPKGFSPWFINANDGTNEGIKHDSLPFFSVQFHPEACPGPMDTLWLFDYFLKAL